MLWLKLSLIVKFPNSPPFSFNTTNSTDQMLFRTTFFRKLQKNMPQESTKSVVTSTNPTIEQLDQRLKVLENQMGYCLANLEKLGIPTDEQTLKDYQGYSRGNPYDC